MARRTRQSRLSPLDDGDQRPARVGQRIHRVRLVGTIMMMIVFFGTAIGVGWYFGVQLSYRTGSAGTPGTIDPVTCLTTTDRDGSSTMCTADFTTLDGLNVVGAANVENGGDSRPRAITPARLHSDQHTVSIVGTAAVAHAVGWLTVALFGFALGLMMVWAQVRRRFGAPAVAQAWEWVVPFVVVVTTITVVAVAWLVGRSAS